MSDTVRVPTDHYWSRLHQRQREVLARFDRGEFRFGMCRWHRRGRKTTMISGLLAREAARYPQRNYIYVGPTYKQAKSIIWRDPNMLFSYLPPKAEYPWESNESELFVRFPHGQGETSLLHIKGADDPDSLRGIDAHGVVFDEWALQKPEIWTEIFRPIMAQDPTRWAIFIYTPKGTNHAWEMEQRALADESGDWMVDVLKASESGLIPADELRKAKEELPTSLYDQEFDCSYVTDEERTVITSAMIDKLRLINSTESLITRRYISCDPALGGDECVAYYFVNTEPMDVLSTHERDAMKVVAWLAMMAVKHDTKYIVIDVVGGIGEVIGARLTEMGYTVFSFDSRLQARDHSRYLNTRAEAYWSVAQMIHDKEVVYPEEMELRRELSAVRYKLTHSSGKMALEPKDDTKKILGRSPDRADAYVQGLYCMRDIPADKDKDLVHDYDMHNKRRSRRGSAMSA